MKLLLKKTRGRLRSNTRIVADENRKMITRKTAYSVPDDTLPGNAGSNSPVWLVESYTPGCEACARKKEESPSLQPGDQLLSGVSYKV